MKVAIIQEWLVSVGGSDKVVKAITDIFPTADIYTLVADKGVCEELGINYSKVNTSLIQKLPFGAKKYKMYLPLFPYAIEQFDLRGYDVIISSSHAVAKGVLTKADQLHISYCHSPIRYVWDMYNEYLEEGGLTKGFKSFLARYLLHRIRKWDVLSSFRVDHFISNSNNVGKRIKKTYRRDSVTIYPNIDISNFTLCLEKEDFYLTSSRLVPYKKIDLIVKAFNQMPDKKLRVIGSGPDYEKIKKIAKSNITVMGYQPFDILKDNMQKAKAFVFAADEDFGMIPIEAQACGTPVIAFGKGGSLETVVNNETGLYFYQQTSDSIIEAVSRFEQIGNTFNYDRIRSHAEKFSEERFKKEIKKYVVEKYDEFLKNK
ncbi:glycosyltransferase family 4 protein [Chryseobacterium sp. KACC 21268]|nr:glycosyltransferase family 4 protein [Chryseobacterium sp. KACC 21268]